MITKPALRHPIKANTDGVFNTATGTLINLNEPSHEMIEIEDIASTLSLICLFGGRAFRFYSVAQHSLLMAALAPEPIKREALLYNSADAFLGGQIKPVKQFFGKRYSQLEKAFEGLVTLKYSLDSHALIAVKDFDNQALEIEHKALQCGDATELGVVMNRSNMVINGSEIFYRPLVAKMEFLRMFGILFPEQVKDAVDGQSV